MNKEEAVDLIFDYLDTLKIMHSEPEEDDENNTEILFVTEGKDSPGGFIESAITFSNNCILARAYYNTVGQKLVTTNLERFPSLFRLLNVINEEKNHLSIQQHSTHFDDDEERSAIFCPQLRMTEDGNYDIKYQLIVDYSYLGLFPNETAHMLACRIPSELLKCICAGSFRGSYLQDEPQRSKIIHSIQENGVY